MSVQALTAVIDNFPGGGTDLILMIMIANHAHADGSNSFPSLITLAKECRCSKMQVTRLIKKLEAEGYLRIERKKNKSNIYSIDLKRLSEVCTDMQESAGSNKMLLGEVDDCQSQNVTRVVTNNVTTGSNIAMLPESSIEPSINQESAVAATHPVIKALQDGVLRRPSKKTEPAIIDLFSDISDLDLITSTAKTWMLRGHNPTNYQGIADWCRNGVPEYHNGKLQPVPVEETYTIEGETFLFTEHDKKFYGTPEKKAETLRLMKPVWPAPVNGARA